MKFFTRYIIIKINEDEMSEIIMKRVCSEWCERTGMGLGCDPLVKYTAKDVNNYVFEFSDGKLERKGKYVKELSELDNDLPIVNRALVDYIVKGVPVEDTINASDDMIDFQQIVRITKAYKYGWHNGSELSEKTFRVYASADRKDTYIGRCKEKGSNPDKFSDTPEHCFIWNDSVKGVKLPPKVDKKWYVDLALKRLEAYGFYRKSEGALF